MEDQFIHENDEGFEAFVENVLNSIGERADKEGICVECLSDRLVVELVSGMVRSGVSVSAILAMVGEGVDAVAAQIRAEQEGKPRRMH